jgi:hypothetical protein
MRLKRSHDDHDMHRIKSSFGGATVEDPTRHTEVFPLDKHPALVWKRKRLN